MGHIHSIYDTDKHFIIDPATRGLLNQTPDKTSVMQYDHDSERITFEMPRVIDGHDMTTCNLVEVHYLNIDAQTKEQRGDVYGVTDLQPSPDDENVAICSWLISRNATQLVGYLFFRLRFVCTTEGEENYAWHTAIYKGLYVSEGIYNGQQVAEEYSDIIAAWTERVIAAENTANGYQAQIDSAEAKATAAVNAADFANEAARKAYIAATEANPRSAEAKATADEAKATADEAKTTADEAKTTADEAAATAEAARAAVGYAHDLAHGASTAAQEAQESAHEATVMALEVERRANEAERRANEAHSKAIDAETAMGDLAGLATTDKSSLVAAINEVAQSGGSAGGDVEGGGDTWELITQIAVAEANTVNNIVQDLGAYYKKVLVYYRTASDKVTTAGNWKIGAGYNGAFIDKTFSTTSTWTMHRALFEIAATVVLVDNEPKNSATNGAAPGRIASYGINRVRIATANADAFFPKEAGNDNQVFNILGVRM